MKDNNYLKLSATLIVSFIIMYTVMFLNAERADHIYLSTTRAYMALLMTAPMAILMIGTMSMMYKSRMMNVIIIFSAALVFSLALFFLRSQAFISDVQYMKAMIPHHSSAILTSKYADIKDPEVKKLSKQIIESQEREIAQMKQLVDRLEEKDQPKPMVTAAIIIILTAAVLGGVMLAYLLSGKHIPKGLAFIHGPLAAAGIIVLVIYAITTSSHHKHYESIILFCVAAIGGIVLFYRDLTGKKLPGWLAIGHAVIALTGIAFLVFHSVTGH